MSVATSSFRSNPLALFAKSRAMRGTVLIASFVAAMQLLLSASEFGVPYRLDVYVAGLPLVALLWGLVVFALTTGTAPEVEAATLGRRLTTLRLIWSSGLLVVVTAASWLFAMLSGTVDGTVAARNSAASAGLVLIAVSVLGSELAWVPPVVLVALLYFGGVDDFQQPRPWALWMHPASHPLAAVASAVLAVAGLVLYVKRDDAHKKRSI